MLKYPFLLYSPRVDLHPLLAGLAGEPFCPDLSHANPELLQVAVQDPASLEAWLKERMGGASWGLAGYLERRDSLLRGYPQMVSQKRFYHLGLDVIVPRGAWLRAPLAAKVADAGHEPGNGNYGAYVLLRHQDRAFEPFYSFYGHLSLESLPSPGLELAAGQPFAQTGDYEENGNWFHHTHLQVITEAGLERGYQFKGYCAAEDLPGLDQLCPSPYPFFRAR